MDSKPVDQHEQSLHPESSSPNNSQDNKEGIDDLDINPFNTNPESSTRESPSQDTQKEEAETEKKQESREVTRERQKEEILLLGDALINRKIREIRKKIDHGQQLTPAENALYQLDLLSKIDIGKEVDISFAQGNEVYVPTDSQKKERLLSIKRRNADDTFTCTVLTVHGSEVGRIIPVKDILAAQRLVESDKIDTLFSSDERQLLNLQKEVILNEGNIPENIDSQEINKIITTTAESNGIITADDIDQLIANVTKENSSLSEEQKKSLQEIHVLLQRQNLADVKSLQHILNVLGCNKNGIDHHIASLKTEIARLEGSSNPTDQKQAEDLKSQLLLWEKFSSDLESNNLFESYLTSMENGLIDKDKAKKIITAIRSGDIDALISTIAGDLIQQAENNEEAQKKLEHLRANLKEIAKGTSLGIGILLLLSILVIAEAAKSIPEK
ncbi:MAG: hypothetical protein KatS3mg089_1016 [Patescibacteria group bacterium]|nr:MAG: hypothetical protein KatS3mg089_1016 [Patescibacteria group bacterium]